MLMEMLGVGGGNCDTQPTEYNGEGKETGGIR